MTQVCTAGTHSPSTFIGTSVSQPSSLLRSSVPTRIPDTRTSTRASSRIVSAATSSSAPAALVRDPRRIAGTTSATRRAAISELKKSSDLDASLSRFGNVLQVQDLNLLLRHFGDLRKWSQISQLFDWMRNHNKVNCPSYSSFIKYMGKNRNHVKALQIYNGISDKTTKSNVSICNAILGCMLKNGEFESSMKLFHQMKEDGLKPDLFTYSTLLSGCVKVKDGYSIAMRLVNELERNNLSKDGVIYGTLLSICASNNFSEEAELLFLKMKMEGLPPNLFHYSSLLNAYSIDGNYRKAEILVKEMEDAGLVANKVTLTTLLKVYVRGGLLEKSKEILHKLRALGHADEEMPYCLIMDHLAKTGNVHEAKIIFDEIIQMNIKSDGYCYSIMISAYCRCGLMKEAKQLALDYESKYERFDLVMLNTLLRVYCNNHDMQKVTHILTKMEELAIYPDWNTFHILLKYFCKEKLYQLAYKTVLDMKSKGHHLDEEICTHLIVLLGQAGLSVEAFSVYNMLRYSKRTVCKSLHEKVLNILLKAQLLKDAYVLMKDNAEHISGSTLGNFATMFMKSGNINMINDVIKAFHRAGLRISQEVFRLAVIRYVTEPEKKELLFHLLQWMATHGYVVDSSTRTTLLKKAHCFGQTHIVADLLAKQHLKARKAQKVHNGAVKTTKRNDR